ncbi:hypothetical protein HZB88_04125 [archaeon]|nr:hypothetical protein [archaeon]
MKRGQATLFVILGVFLLLIVGMLLIFEQEISSYFKKSELQREVILPSEVAMVNELIRSCLIESAQDAVSITALQGGYCNINESLTKYQTKFFLNISPYYLVSGIEIIPKIEEIKNNLSLCTKEGLHSCLKDTPMPNLSYELKNEDISIEMQEGELDIKLKTKFKLIFNTSTFILEDFETNVKTNYSKLYALSVMLTEEQETYGNKICISCINDLSYDTGISIYTTESFEYPDYIIIYYLVQEDNAEDPANVYSFAHKFEIGGY